MVIGYLSSTRTQAVTERLGRFCRPKGDISFDWRAPRSPRVRPPPWYEPSREAEEDWKPAPDGRTGGATSERAAAAPTGLARCAGTTAAVPHVGAYLHAAPAVSRASR